ncbi:hypothetical protein E5676_scaffold562G00810 [Cucumis melo var. makuwa]|uniref:DUF4218 domain-containing protein n=1 Tax=Cucumis melo var. makuwa TaxID=1194695 RepID=A0A5D3BKN7_CUCMM|nr:hypothetical protein E5676_scaffold562G00810 [Cucumis melo var. makuwa]
MLAIEDDDILDLLNDLQGSMKAREEDFDDRDGFDDEFPEDVDEMDTSNVFEELTKLKRLFLSKRIASEMRWHKDKRVDTKDVLRRPADVAGWKHFDKEFPQFASEPRNVCLGLASDSFNPFGNMSTAYSMWPVVLIPYNLPPWKCMKESNFFMSLLVPGPKSLGKELDTIRVSDLNRLEADIVLILYKLERIFPPAFFDVMIHLAVHLPAETKIVGPVSYSWMYPIERSLRALKQYVQNKARPEGSIAEAFIMNECLTFCSMYLTGIETRFNKNPQNDDSMNRQLVCGDFEVFKQNVRPMGGSVVRTLSEDEKSMCHCGCFENGLRFHSIERDNRRTTQKSGIMAYRETKAEEMNYYGVLQERNGSQLGTKKRARGVRGYGRNIELDKFVEKHGKIKIEINEEEGKPVTTFAPKIVLGIGTAVRNTIPLSCENWKAVPMGVRKLVIDRLEKKKKGCDVDEIEVFHETHFRDKEGWINDGKRCIQSTEAGVQTISSAKACEFVLGSRSMQTVNPRSGESLRSNVSSTREKEKNEMAYLKEANEKLTHELAKWEQSYGSQSCI